MAEVKTDVIIPIVYEDDLLVVINKPFGIVVNRAESVKEMTLQDWMDTKFKVQSSKFKIDNEKLIKEFLSRSGVVHRLDKDTSGILVLAKTPEAFSVLKSQFMERKTKKEYRALVHGVVSPNKGSIRLPLKRNILNRHRFTVSVEGKMSVTSYEVNSKFKMQNAKLQEEVFTLMNLYPETGRTHQLRVHLSFLGYPIVSDPLYLGKRLKGDLNWCPRLFLHAYKLGFFHPETKEWMEFTADLPQELSDTFTRLEKVN